MYGLYDFQDRISEVHKDMLQIYDVDHESKQKVEQLEKETNDLLDEICKKHVVRLMMKTVNYVIN